MSCSQAGCFFACNLSCYGSPTAALTLRCSHIATPVAAGYEQCSSCKPFSMAVLASGVSGGCSTDAVAARASGLRSWWAVASRMGRLHANQGLGNRQIPSPYLPHTPYTQPSVEHWCGRCGRTQPAAPSLHDTWVYCLLGIVHVYSSARKPFPTLCFAWPHTSSVRTHCTAVHFTQHI